MLIINYPKHGPCINKHIWFPPVAIEKLVLIDHIWLLKLRLIQLYLTSFCYLLSFFINNDEVNLVLQFPMLIFSL